MSQLQVRKPEIQLSDGELIWSRIPEFSLAYNGYSVVIPYVEFYLNSVMNEVKDGYCESKPALREDLNQFIKQEVQHARFHMRYNKRMFDLNIEGLPELVEEIQADLKKFRETKSLAFNVGYCAGFECIATFDSVYLYEECDDYFDGADPHGANLLLWHVAEEFEHRCVCHDAFRTVSGNYFTRIYALVYAFIHVGGAFMRSEELILAHYLKDKPESVRKASIKQSKKLFWRQIRYVAPRMLKIFLPGYNPARLRVPKRINAALDFFNRADPITKRVELVI